VTEVIEGQLLARKYRVERVLCVGGMGIVVAARHVLLDQRVAVKILRSEMLANPDVLARFGREARAAAKIKSEHVARVLDVGALETGAPYMVMEFLDGTDLSTWIRQHGPLSVALAVDFVLQACVAVAEAHALGIVHRDLKPANLFCVRGTDGQLTIKVIDFGISKLSNFNAPATGSATKTNILMGSPAYMSPEQMRSSRDVDGRTDVWALGVVLFELLTGRMPFEGETVADVLVNIATAKPARMREFRPQVPEALESAVLACLRKDPSTRYRTVADLAMALRPFGSIHAENWIGRTVAISSGGLTAPPVEIAAADTKEWSASGKLISAQPQRHDVLAGIWGAVAALSIVLAAVGAGMARGPVMTRSARTLEVRDSPQAAAGIALAPIPPMAEQAVASDIDGGLAPPKAEAFARQPLPKRRANDAKRALNSPIAPLAVPAPARATTGATQSEADLLLGLKRK